MVRERRAGEGPGGRADTLYPQVQEHVKYSNHVVDTVASREVVFRHRLRRVTCI